MLQVTAIGTKRSSLDNKEGLQRATYPMAREGVPGMQDILLSKKYVYEFLGTTYVFITYHSKSLFLSIC